MNGEQPLPNEVAAARFVLGLSNGSERVRGTSGTISGASRLACVEGLPNDTEPAGPHERALSPRGARSGTYESRITLPGATDEG
jgi:hypothetical protein